jgi:heptosyltransferase-2
MTEDEPSQILVVRLGSIGDVLLATPLVRALRLRYPRARLGFLTRAAYAPLLEGNPHLDRVLVWPESSGQPGQGARGVAAAGERQGSSADGPWSVAALELAAGLRADRPIWLVDLQSSPRTLAWSARLRPDRRFRYRKEYVRRALLIHARLDRYPDPVPSVAERYFGAVQRLGLKPDSGGLELALTEEERGQAGSRLPEREGPAGGPTAGDGVRRRWLAVAPGARWATKRWPPESFAAAARRVAERHDLDVILLGSPEDAPISRALKEMLREAGVAVLDLTGRLGLRESAAVLSRASLLLSNDSGLMHVASALRVPTVAVFGSTAPQLGFAPYRAPAHVIGVQGLPCRPCTHMGRPACPLGHFRCMREVDPERAVRAAGEFLSETRDEALQTAS